MEVKCISKERVMPYGKKAFSPALTIGKTYIVIEISCGESSGLDYRLIDDDSDNSALYFFSQFEVVDARLSSYWVADVSKDGIYLSPKEWSDLGFWEKFYDGEEKEVSIFKETVKKILGEWE